jgi:outer membrane protein assembly factor BamE (lipoprotein component of BamABCDE complex)
MIFKHLINIILILSFFILNACQFQDPDKNHGIIFLKNRSEKIIVNKSNKNDVIKILGKPHSRAFDEEDKWLYIERVLTKGKYHKLGQHVLKTNNVLVLKFNKYGVIVQKKIYDKNDKNKLAFIDKTTKNELSKKSFIQSFLQSIKQKMYSNRK